MTVTTNRKVELMSNAKGDAKKYAQDNKLFKSKEQRKDNRASAKEARQDLRQQYKTGAISKEEFKTQKKSRRKAKRNAVKLQLLKRFTRDGKPLFVYRLKEVIEDRQTKKLQKRMPDGKTVEVPRENVVQTPQGMYDLSEIAKAMNVSVDQLKTAQAQLIDILIPLASSSKGQTEAVNVPKSDTTADLAVSVPESNMTDLGGGEYFLTNETFDGDMFDASSPVPDVADDEKPPLKGWEKGLLWGGIAVVAIVLGVIIYRKVKSNAGSN
jgi:hypothetical protein